MILLAPLLIPFIILWNWVKSQLMLLLWCDDYANPLFFFFFFLCPWLNCDENLFWDLNGDCDERGSLLDCDWMYGNCVDCDRILGEANCEDDGIDWDDGICESCDAARFVERCFFVFVLLARLITGMDDRILVAAMSCSCCLVFSSESSHCANSFFTWFDDWFKVDSNSFL